MANAKPLEIFRPGRHTATNGTTLEFTEADVAATVAAYDIKKHAAPLVKGHPRMDDPAYGRVASLAIGPASIMLANPYQVEPSFADEVNAGRFPKISASLYAPNAPNNPVPGVYYLRHVGFLGAMPPAVKGLADASFASSEAGTVSFAADEAGVFTIEFGEWDDQVNAGLWRRLREWFIAKFGQDEADKVIPGYDVGTLEEFARQEFGAEAPPAFSESTHQPITEQPPMATPEELAAQAAELKRKEEEIKAREANFSEREATLAAQEKAAKRQSIVEFVEGLVKASKVLPRDQAGLIEFMAADDKTAVLEFGEGDAKTKIAGDAFLRQFLGNLPKAIEYAELAGGAEDASAGANTDDAAIARRARMYHSKMQDAGENMSFAEAVDAVRAGKDKG